MTDFFEWECQKQVEFEEILAKLEEQKQRERDIRRGKVPKAKAKALADDTGQAGAARVLLQ